MTHTTELTRTATAYLRSLRRALSDHEVDRQARAALLVDIQDALTGLDDAEVREQINRLGSPEQIAQNAAQEQPAPSATRPTRGGIAGTTLIILAVVSIGLAFMFFWLWGAILGAVAVIGALVSPALNGDSPRRYRNALWLGIAGLLLNLILLSVGMPFSEPPASDNNTVVTEIN